MKEDIGGNNGELNLKFSEGDELSLKNKSRAPDLKKGAPIQALQKGL